MSSGIRPAEVRYYVDADLLGLARVLVTVRNDVTFPGDQGGDLQRRRRPPSPVLSPSTKDTDWIPEVTRRGWLIITRDRQIGVHRAEIASVRDHGARMVALSGREAIGTFAQLEVLLCRWRDVEALHDLPGPFIYSATRTGLTPISLE